MARVLMIQGTMSNVGKSLLVAGLCRIFREDGYRVAPFKSQNMALNSYVTKEGLEMGRAQVMQAEAAGIHPVVAMNPILLKPTDDTGSQVIVNGEVVGVMSAKEYFAYKQELVPDILRAYHSLEKQADIIVVEGAGSPAEINLREHDIVNMGLANLLDAPVFLAGDIDRGGVFAQLLGTQMLLAPSERARIKGFIINKFRGDVSLLLPGVRAIEKKCGVPVTGVVPYLHLALEEEDGLSERFDRQKREAVDIAVVHFPRIANYTDFDVFATYAGVSLRYVKHPRELCDAAMIILPGSKNTMEDLRWLRESGLGAAIEQRAKDTLIMGICGGYQMLGQSIRDLCHVEAGGGMSGLNLLPVETELKPDKVRTRVSGSFLSQEGILSPLCGKALFGYEIHMGETRRAAGSQAFCRLRVEACGTEKEDGCVLGNVFGTYVHGIFDAGDVAACMIQIAAAHRGIAYCPSVKTDYAAHKETQYQKLAGALRAALDLRAIYASMGMELP